MSPDARFRANSKGFWTDMSSWPDEKAFVRSVSFHVPQEAGDQTCLFENLSTLLAYLVMVLR